MVSNRNIINNFFLIESAFFSNEFRFFNEEKTAI